MRSLGDLLGRGSLGILGDCCKWEPSCYCNGDTLCGECGGGCRSGVVTEPVPRGVDYIGASHCKFGVEQGGGGINMGGPKLVVWQVGEPTVEAMCWENSGGPG